MTGSNRKYSAFFALCATILCMTAGADAQYTPRGWLLDVANDEGDLYYSFWVDPAPTQDFHFYGAEGSNFNNAAWKGLGTGLIESSGFIEVSGVPQSEVTGLVSALAGKQASLPTQTGQSGKVLGTNGSAVSWVDQPTTPTRSFSYPTRTLGSCFQPSATKDTLVNYSVDVGTTSTLAGGQTGTVYLEIFTNSSCTTGTQELTRFVNGNSQTLGLTVTMVQNVTGLIGGVVPAGYYAKIRTANTVGTPSFTYRSGQEVTDP